MPWMRQKIHQALLMTQKSVLTSMRLYLSLCGTLRDLYGFTWWSNFSGFFGSNPIFFQTRRGVGRKWKLRVVSSKIMLKMSTILVQPQHSPRQSCINHPMTEFPILIQCVQLVPNKGFKLFQNIRGFGKKRLFIIHEMKNNGSGFWQCRHGHAQILHLSMFSVKKHKKMFMKSKVIAQKESFKMTAKVQKLQPYLFW